jgi:hypothetical protein
LAIEIAQQNGRFRALFRVKFGPNRPKAIVALRDGDGPTYRGRYASFSAAAVARWRVGTKGCNIVIGEAPKDPPPVPIRGASPGIIATQRDHGAAVK